MICLSVNADDTIAAFDEHQHDPDASPFSKLVEPRRVQLSFLKSKHSAKEEDGFRVVGCNR